MVCETQQEQEGLMRKTDCHASTVCEVWRLHADDLQRLHAQRSVMHRANRVLTRPAFAADDSEMGPCFPLCKRDASWVSSIRCKAVTGG